MGRRVGVAVVGLAVLLTACSGGGEGGLGFLPESDDATLEQSAAAVEVLVERWGDEGAFFAVMASFDAGYDADQIVSHVADLTAGGTITGEDPAGPALGLAEPLPGGDAAAPPRSHAAPRRLTAALGDAPRDGYVGFVDATFGEAFAAGEDHLRLLKARAEFAEVLADLRDTGFLEYVTGLTVLLRLSGYGAEEIVEAILLGTFDIALTSNGGRCTVITGDDGATVAPTGITTPWMDTLCPGVFTGDTAPGGTADADCDPAVLGRPLDADERRECYNRNVPALTVGITGPATTEPGTAVDVGLTITGGRPPFTASIVWGDGFADPLAVDVGPSYTGFAQQARAASHTFGAAGEYTITLTVTDGDGREATASLALTVAAPTPADHSGRYAGAIAEAVDNDMITYTANRVVVVVDGTDANLRRFTLEWETVYTGFTTGGGTYQADCLGVGSRTLQSAEIVFDGPDTVRGTVVIDWVHHDTGSDCPFGGVNYERTWSGEVVGEFVDGVLHLAFTGSAEGLATETFTVEAPLAAGDA